MKRYVSHSYAFCIAVIAILSVAIAAPAYPQDKSVSQLNKSAMEFARDGKYVESFATLKEALDQSKRTASPDKEDLVATLNTIAAIYSSQGNYAKAEMALKRVVAIRTLAVGDKVSDKNYSQISTAMRSLVKLYVDWGKYDKAEKVFKNVIGVEKNAFGRSYAGNTEDIELLINLYDTLLHFRQLLYLQIHRWQVLLILLFHAR